MRKRSDTSTGELFDAFVAEVPQPRAQIPGTMDFRAEVTERISHMLAQAEKDHGIDRWGIAAQVSRLTGQDTSKGVLDQYTSIARDEYNAPLWKVPVIELACKSRELADWHVQLLGGRVYWGREVMDAEIGRMEREVEQMRHALRAAKALRRRTG